MNGDSEKPFEATPHRIVKAKREGNVARANELAANLSFAAAGLALLGVAPLWCAVAGHALRGIWSGGAPAFNLLIPAVAFVPIGAAAVAGAFGCVLQSGGFTVNVVEPKLERLNLVEGFKRILSRETLAHSARAALAFSCAILAMLPLLGWTASSLVQTSTLANVSLVAWNGARNVAVAACAVGFLFAVAEYGAARRQWLRKLRMSFEERKREAKEEEGDAVARGRRRSLHRALSRSGMRRLREAAFVVVNPRHIAVALEYRPPQIAVPRVLVRAADAVALRVRAAAGAHAIPLVENVLLARALYRDGREGEPIPHAHYVAVAEVVGALLRAKEIAR